MPGVPEEWEDRCEATHNPQVWLLAGGSGGSL